jgi:hypothetical protein
MFNNQNLINCPKLSDAKLLWPFHLLLEVHNNNLYNYYWKYTTFKSNITPDSPDVLPCTNMISLDCCKYLNTDGSEVTPNKCDRCFGNENLNVYSCSSKGCTFVQGENGDFTEGTCGGICNKMEKYVFTSRKQNNTKKEDQNEDKKKDKSKLFIWLSIIVFLIFISIIYIVSKKK